MSEPRPEASPEADSALPESGPNGVALTEPHTEPSGHLRVYVTVLLLAPFLFLAACVAIIRSDFFLRHDQNVYLANMGYGTKLHNADCQVLIYGDSSAMVGVDPATVQANTGLSTCNIAEAAGMTMVNGTMILDEYLKQNPRPRYLVFLFAPENLAPYATWKYAGYFEAVLIRIRRRLDLAFLRMTLLHAEEVLSSAEMAGRFALSWARNQPLPASLLHDRERNRGRLDAQGDPLTSCDPLSRLNPPSRVWTDRLRARYAIGGTTVLIDVTPVPACDPALSTYRVELAPGAGIVDNLFHTYPVDWYTQNGRLHMSPQGIATLSDEIAAQIDRTAGEAR